MHAAWSLLFLTEHFCSIACYNTKLNRVKPGSAPSKITNALMRFNERVGTRQSTTARNISARLRRMQDSRLRIHSEDLTVTGTTAVTRFRGLLNSLAFIFAFSTPRLVKRTALQILSKISAINQFYISRYQQPMEQDCFLLRPIFLRRWLPWTCPRSLSESSTQSGSHLRSAFVRARRATQNAVVPVCACCDPFTFATSLSHSQYLQGSVN